MMCRRAEILVVNMLYGLKRQAGLLTFHSSEDML